MNDSVCIVGVGAVTPVGLNAPATAAAVRAGIASFADHPYMINQEGEPYVVAMVPGVNGTLGVERYADLALPAIEEALYTLVNKYENYGQMPVIIGLPEARPGLPGDLSNKLEAQVKETFLTKNVQTLQKGHSAGLIALETGCNLVLQNTIEFCLIGGVDSYIDPDTLDWIEDNEQLHTSLNAWGFVPGEAAAFCLVCTTKTALKYELPVKAQLVAISTAIEENKIKTQTVCIGQGLTEAVRNAVEKLPTDTQIDYTVCDQNGEAYRADEFGFMLARLSENFVDPSDFMAPADCWGDVGAASGPLFLNLILSSAEKGHAKGCHTLAWTSSEGGERTAAILRSNVETKGMA